MSERISTGSGLWRSGLIAALIAAVANEVIWVLLKVVGADLAVEIGGETQDVMIFQPFLSTFIASVAGLGIGWLLGRSGRASWWRPFIWAAAVVSLLSPLLSGTDLLTKVGLGLMHLVAAALLVTRTSGP
ncbi:MAG: DUF6069 family protein [Nocardioides sp.]